MDTGVTQLFFVILNDLPHKIHGCQVGGGVLLVVNNSPEVWSAETGHCSKILAGHDDDAGDAKQVV